MCTNNTDIYGRQGFFDNATDSYIITSGAIYDLKPRRKDVAHSGVDGERGVT